MGRFSAMVMLALGLGPTACSKGGGEHNFGGTAGGVSDGSATETSSGAGASGSVDEGTSGGLDEEDTSADGEDPKFDVMSDDLGGGGGSCVVHTPCDADTEDPFQAMGLGCPGETPVTTSVNAHPDGLMIIDGFGADATYAPREGERNVLMSTGILPGRIWTEPDSPSDSLGHCNMWFSPGDGMDTTQFPPPIRKNDVNGDCLQDPSLVGTGDCSNSIESQFEQSGFKYDYQELRFSTTVPEGVEALVFNVAYLTTEWPIYANQPYNDMFIAWVESPSWTGNVSFDEMGNALSLNAAFFEYLDHDGNLPQFQGTCLRWHGGTKWLETTVPVTPGEEIEVVFAIFDLEDVNWDSMVLIDNVHWECGEVGPGPGTVPEG